MISKLVLMIKTEPYSWTRVKRFYHRNNVLFWCIGTIGIGHLFWWQVQQNRLFIGKHERRRTLGPIPVPYLDEYDLFKSNNNTKSGSLSDKPNE